jgi:hypothetical protein
MSHGYGNLSGYFLNNFRQKQDRGLRFSSFERGDEDASNRVINISLVYCLNFV